MKKKFSQHWLEVLCSLLPEVQSALIMMPDENQKIKPLATWPDYLENYDDFTPIVEYALKKQTQVCIPNPPGHDQQAIDFFALPLYLKSELLGIIVTKINHVTVAQHEPIFNTLQQSAQWLELSHATQNTDDGFYSKVTGLLAACFEQESYHQGLIQLVTELTKTFDCDHVAFGEIKNNYCHLVALSNSSKFDTRSNIMQQISDAMDEAIDQDSAIVFPDTFPNPSSHLIRRSHQILADNFGSESLCTIPLINDQQVFGAVTLLRNEETPFDSNTVNLCQQTLALVTPYLALKQADESSLFNKLISGLKQKLQNLFGIKYLKLKLITGTSLLLLLLATFIHPDYRVTAAAVLEGKVQRVVAAPINGFLLSASVQAGDTVHEGDIMATLDDTDLLLQLAQNRGQLQQSRREYREALSARDLVNVSVINAKINQIVAEMNLTRLKLKQIRLKAPFNGVVIDGDLTQMLGSPVERGDTLFKIAPLEGYRIILKVDERDIAQIKPGQKGALTLTSMPERNFPLLVEKITAIANTDDNANIFRVEAALQNIPDLLRPGMEGIGKISVGRASLLWIWTHEMVDWFRLKLWSWWF